MPYFRGSELNRVYDAAKDGGYGFVASNTTHPDIMVGQVNGAAAVNSDAVLQLKHDTATYVGNGDPVTGLHVMGEYARRLGEDSDVGVFLNMDHVDPANEEFLQAAIASGLPSSIMVDASDEPFEENIAQTKAVVDEIEAQGQDMLVEAELGKIKGTESGVTTTEAYYTDPEDAVEFVDRTGCDLLAISIGTEHGVSKGKDLKLRPDIARDVNEALLDHGLDIPLVVHGSSGLSPQQVEDLLQTGVCKLNKNTRYQYEYARTALEFYDDNRDSIVPPEGVADDRKTFFSDAEWSPDKSDFNPQVVGREVRGRIADVMQEVSELAGSAGESLYA